MVAREPLNGGVCMYSVRASLPVGPGVKCAAGMCSWWRILTAVAIENESAAGGRCGAMSALIEQLSIGA